MSKENLTQVGLSGSSTTKTEGEKSNKTGFLGFSSSLGYSGLGNKFSYDPEAMVS